MQVIGWSYDLAREQAPTAHGLADVLRRSRDAGYAAVGLYLEHRFAYRSAPWAAGPGCVTPAGIRRVAGELHGCGLRIIPFLNTLGHMEGFCRAEGGQHLAEGPGSGSLQICPSRAECVAFARGLVADAIDAFDDEWVHLGGDETRQLGRCPLCAERVGRIGKGGLYGEYFGSLCRWVLERGRRPCLWGDMLVAHPAALDALPRETVIFDWQYEHRPLETTRMFRERGFDVVCCPSVHSYDSAWCHVGLTQRNIDEHAADAREAGALGVLVTSWECSHFSQYAGLLPLIYAAGRRLARGEDWAAAVAAEGGDNYARVADILGNRIPAAAAFLRPGAWRQLRDRFVMRQNPFALWHDWRDEALGETGDAILRLCDEAAKLCAAPSGPTKSPDHQIAKSPNREASTTNALRFAIELHRVAVEWVRLVERAYQRYAGGDLAECAAVLNHSVDVLGRLRPGLEAARDQGGSTADVARLEALQRKTRQVHGRVQALQAGRSHEHAKPSTSYRPTFATLVHDAYVPDDQAAWRTGEFC